jgi:hypothetical protein
MLLSSEKLMQSKSPASNQKLRDVLFVPGNSEGVLLRSYLEQILMLKTEHTCTLPRVSRHQPLLLFSLSHIYSELYLPIILVPFFPHISPSSILL